MLRALIPEGIDYGSNLMVEFEPDSLWYEVSLSIAAQALREGAKVVYHTFQRAPDEIRQALNRFGLDVKKLEDEWVLEIADSYAAQIGLGLPEAKPFDPITQSLKVSDWSIPGGQALKPSFVIPEEYKRWLHIDDNTGILLQYNQEKAIIDFWRTRGIHSTRKTEEVNLSSFLKGIASDTFYRQFESLCDGIVDLKKEEKGGEIEHYLRLRIMRGKRYDSRWHQLQLQDNGEVKLAN